MKLGVTLRKRSAQFAIHSRANRLWLLLFDSPQAGRPSRKIEMKRGGTDGLWQAEVRGIGPGALYAYQTDAVPEKWLLDPRATAIHFPRGWGERDGLQAGSRLRTDANFPKCVVTDPSFDWKDDRPPAIPAEETIIYEAHLRGMTRAEGGGTYRDILRKIPYLKELGVTAIEFLPVFEFNELEYFLEGGARKNLLNYWGYSTLAFFAPMSRYAESPEPGAAVREFKTMVRELHAAGIEVILDVVFNHTAEGSFEGPVYSFRGLDEQSTYILRHDGSYADWTGCGNTVNANHPVTREWIVDCLSYWAEEMHVDGFRFDLATALCRDGDGNLLENPPLIEAIESAPALQHVKLIAEAWDAVGTYQVGSFPGKRFAEWNGRYRDDVRRFWNNGEAVGSLATRLAGSADLYEAGGFTPIKSINFITSHDGFTLADLVQYERKHNKANCEGNRDGEDHNNSTSFEHEGPSDNPDLCAMRRKQQKNLLATLLLSRGIPMLTAGDEFGRTQQGNNNAYCQDNEISWIDWALVERNRDLLEFTKRLISLRLRFKALHRGSFYSGENDVMWSGPDGSKPDWDFGRALAMRIEGDPPLLLLFNGEDKGCTFTLPGLYDWETILCSDEAVPDGTAYSKSVALPPMSVCILKG